MLDIQTFNCDFNTLANLYDTNNVPGFVIKNQFLDISYNINTKNIRDNVKNALYKMTPKERKEFIRKQRELWAWN